MRKSTDDPAEKKRNPSIRRRSSESDRALRLAFGQVFGRDQRVVDQGNYLRVALLDTPLGPMLAAVNHRAVCGLEFAGVREMEKVRLEMLKRFGLPALAGDNAVLERLRGELREYFQGERRVFTVPVMLRGTAFQQRVWRELQRIPYGETTCYETIAKRVESPLAVRAVGRANGTNRICLLVPCHRVIAKDGTLSGYGGAVWRKRELLALEST